MNSTRTGGMTAIGILNIVFGSIGAIVAVFVVLLGGLFAAGGAGLASQAGHEAQGAGAAIAGGGALVMVMGLVGLGFWGALAVSGIGVLKMTPWAPKLAMICGVGGVCFTLLSVVSSGFSIGIVNVLTLGYCCTLLYLFMQPQWKNAFCASGSASCEPQPSSAIDPNKYRAAA